MEDLIHFILTGGTIEKAYDPITEKPEFRNNSIIPDYLQGIVKMYPKRIFDVVCQIDSVHMTDSIRDEIAKVIHDSPAEHIMIIHGTSTMQDTAQYLLNSMGVIDKTVVLTGAMIPLKEFAMSDAGFNLGYAAAQVLSLPQGFYVCMNAHTFKADEVTKNVQEGRFEVLS